MTPPKKNPPKKAVAAKPLTDVTKNATPIYDELKAKYDNLRSKSDG